MASPLMSWIYLIIAGMLEMGWPVGLKLSQTAPAGMDSVPVSRITGGILLAVVFMAASGFFLWLAQRTIPIGTAYAVWTGIGAVGTFAIGIFFFGDSAHPLRLLSAFLLVAGIVGLKLAPH